MEENEKKRNKQETKRKNTRIMQKNQMCDKNRRQNRTRI